MISLDDQAIRRPGPVFGAVAGLTSPRPLFDALRHPTAWRSPPTDL